MIETITIEYRVKGPYAIIYEACGADFYPFLIVDPTKKRVAKENKEMVKPQETYITEVIQWMKSALSHFKLPTIEPSPEQEQEPTFKSKYRSLN